MTTIRTIRIVGRRPTNDAKQILGSCVTTAAAFLSIIMTLLVIITGGQEDILVAAASASSSSRPLLSPHPFSPPPASSPTRSLPLSPPLPHTLSNTLAPSSNSTMPAFSMPWRGVDLSQIGTEDCDGACPPWRATPTGPHVDALKLLRSHGANVFRMRAWVNPCADHRAGCNASQYSYANTTGVLRMARRCREAGLQFVLDLHFSDWWADPGHQYKPVAWRTLGFSALCSAVETYARTITQALVDQGTPPVAVQIGNEITAGMLWEDDALGQSCADGGRLWCKDKGLKDHGDYYTTRQAGWDRLGKLVAAGIKGVKTGCSAVLVRAEAAKAVVTSEIVPQNTAKTTTTAAAAAAAAATAANAANAANMSRIISANTKIDPSSSASASSFCRIAIHTDLGNHIETDGIEWLGEWYGNLSSALLKERQNQDSYMYPQRLHMRNHSSLSASSPAASSTNSASATSNASVVDFDLIGLSMYPKWDKGTTFKSIEALPALAARFPDKHIYIAETAYPAVASAAPAPEKAYPATPAGQAAYLSAVFGAMETALAPTTPGGRAAAPKASQNGGALWWDGSETGWDSLFAPNGVARPALLTSFQP